MSERSSFVTEYVYCGGCLNKLKAVLLKEERYLIGAQIPIWDADYNEVEHLPIIAGKIGSTGPLGEAVTLQNLFNSNNAPCHSIRICILHDCGDSNTFIVSPDGNVFLSSTTSK